MKTESEEKDWVKVLYEVILKILTLGFYHVEKHRRAWSKTARDSQHSRSITLCFDLRFPHCNSTSYIGDPSERVKELKN